MASRAGCARGPASWLGVMAWAMLVTCKGWAAGPTAEEVFAQTGARGALFVAVGESAELAVGLASAGPVLVHLLAARRAAAAAREGLAASGAHGQVRVSELDGTGRLAVADGLAAAVVADLDAHPRLAEGEVLRILRPSGKGWVKKGGVWQVVEKPRPDDIDDWPQYFDDGAGSDLSQELRAGPAHGLQWEAGPHHTTKIGVRVVGSVWVGVDQAGLVARHAFSGLPPWRRDVVATDGTIACFGAAAEQ